MKVKPVFTVFTPTYNRQEYLQLVYESLNKQKLFHLFEWLIIDDGSTDNTSQFIKKIKKKSNFNINYFYQTNQGKHIAHNHAISKANGELVIFLDSDDQLLPNSISYLHRIWKKKNKKQKKEIAGFLGHCVDHNKKIIGSKWKHKSENEYLHFLIFYDLIVGEKIPIYRLDILKNFLFPKLINDKIKFIPEGFVWLEISKYYKIQMLDLPIRIYNINTPGSLMSATKTYYSNPKGKKLLFDKLGEFLDIYKFKRFKYSLKIIIIISLLNIINKEKLFKFKKRYSTTLKFLFIITLPISFLKSLIEKLK
jgi:glycosyltransferase involved in cell wall biosynthesis